MDLKFPNSLQLSTGIIIHLYIYKFVNVVNNTRYLVTVRDCVVLNYIILA